MTVKSQFQLETLPRQLRRRLIPYGYEYLVSTHSPPAVSLSAREARILTSIVVASENDPAKPEFPADDPKFPATPTYRIQVPGFFKRLAEG